MAQHGIGLIERQRANSIALSAGGDTQGSILGPESSPSNPFLLSNVAARSAVPEAPAPQDATPVIEEARGLFEQLQAPPSAPQERQTQAAPGGDFLFDWENDKGGAIAHVLNSFAAGLQGREDPGDQLRFQRAQQQEIEIRQQEARFRRADVLMNYAPQLAATVMAAPLDEQQARLAEVSQQAASLFGVDPSEVEPFIRNLANEDLAKNTAMMSGIHKYGSPELDETFFNLVQANPELATSIFQDLERAKMMGLAGLGGEEALVSVRHTGTGEQMTVTPGVASDLFSSGDWIKTNTPVADKPEGRETAEQQARRAGLVAEETAAGRIRGEAVDEPEVLPDAREIGSFFAGVTPDVRNAAGLFNNIVQAVNRVGDFAFGTLLDADTNQASEALVTLKVATTDLITGLFTGQNSVNLMNRADTVVPEAGMGPNRIMGRIDATISFLEELRETVRAEGSGPQTTEGAANTRAGMASVNTLIGAYRDLKGAAELPTAQGRSQLSTGGEAVYLGIEQ